ncbi:carbohydrate esterase family 5 protein [Exidia glandulosa HHB12029]|uniref:Carbohydrate esterase family 5 protein n=1 Tax=Exidia glandulosa HHB12029 TaxID=1314781 RepID=A0A165PNZ2_EXIGL|nr:carbohydrate esterase family 5 protein [Exidia glandulosa HHB12029]
MSRVSLFLLAAATTGALAQCPQVHVFGARETTAPPGYGTAGPVVNSILSAFPGSTSEVITYPACGGQSTCGSVSYADSVKAGVKAIASQVNSFNSQCPNTFLVFVGYSQGGQIFDDAYCGGGDTNEGLSDTSIPISAAAQKQVKAAIFMGDPRHIPGLSFNVGTCQASGFAPRPAGFQCPYASNIQSYCDAADPYCCNGNDANTHQGYANEYGSVALTFVRNKLNAAISGGGSTTTGPTSTGGSTPPTSTVSTPAQPQATQAKYGQCGGIGWTGPTVCASGSTCVKSNDWYSQCL